MHRYACRFTRLVTLLLMVAAIRPLQAQDGPYSFIHYGTEQGLSNDFITCIATDRMGFLWVGTPNGLNRFDGRRFRTFQHEGAKASQGLPGNYIVALVTGPDGLLWISTDQGLCRLDPERLAFQPVTLPEDKTAAPAIVRKVAFDHRGYAWFFQRGALYCLDPQTARVVETCRPLEHTEGELDVYIDRQNVFWLTANTALFRFDPQTHRVVPYFLDAARTRPFGAFDMAEDRNGDLFFITWAEGLFRYNRTADRLEHLPGVVNLTRRFLPDTTLTGRPFFWVGGDATGLVLFFPDKQVTQQLPNDKRDPYTNNGVAATCLFKAPHSGDVWIGTEVGLEHYTPTALRFGRAIIPEEHDFGPYNLVSGFAYDRTDTTGEYYFIGVWANCLFRWNRRNGTFERLKKSPRFPLLSDEVFFLSQSHDGYLWLDLAGGIARYDPRTRRLVNWKMRFRVPKRNNKILSSVEDRNGTMWFGANADGLFRFNARTQRPEHVPFPPELTFPGGDLAVHSMAADTTGRIWLACNRGVICYDPRDGSARPIRIPGGPEIYDCMGVAVGRNGHVWFTSNKFIAEVNTDGTVLRQIGPKEGLRCSRAFYILEDHAGNIWFNSDYLLHCLNPRDCTFTYYGLADGLFSNAPTDGLNIMPDGDIFVGFQNAFNFFNPARLRRNTTPPPVVITSIKVLDRERPLNEPLVLYPGQNMLSVEFAALNFSQPLRNRYAYLLEGFNQDWIYTDRPVAVYTNLSGGRHTLRLKAANNDGVWNETGATLQFRVVPPFYQRWYFYLGLVLLGVAITFAIARYRFLQRRRLEIFRERLARDLHDEMGSTLSSIRFFSDFAQTQIAAASPATLPVLQRISQSATALSESMQDIIWAMKTRYDQLDDIASRMTEFGLRLLEARGVRFVARIDDHLPAKRLLPEQRRNLYLIFKEALNNAAKYAECTEVQLIFSMEKGDLILVISDNGKGFDVHSKEAGNGLHNMRQRAAEIGGQLHITSAADRGTRVEVRLAM